MSAYKDEYKEYTMGLALFDIMPVLLFLASGLIMYSMYGSPLLLAGVLACFMGGLCKAIWKMIVVVSEKDFSGLTRMFHILMPAGFVLMILSVFAGGKAAFSGLWRSLTMMPASILFVAGFVLIAFLVVAGNQREREHECKCDDEKLFHRCFFLRILFFFHGTIPDFHSYCHYIIEGVICQGKSTTFLLGKTLKIAKYCAGWCNPIQDAVECGKRVPSGAHALAKRRCLGNRGAILQPFLCNLPLDTEQMFCYNTNTEQMFYIRRA
jgi:hypothetical protein